MPFSSSRKKKIEADTEEVSRNLRNKENKKMAAEEGQVIACHTTEAWDEQLRKGKETKKLVFLNFSHRSLLAFFVWRFSCFRILNLWPRYKFRLNSLAIKSRIGLYPFSAYNLFKYNEFCLILLCNLYIRNQFIHCFDLAG